MGDDLVSQALVQEVQYRTPPSTLRQTHEGTPGFCPWLNCSCGKGVAIPKAAHIILWVEPRVPLDYAMTSESRVGCRGSESN
jgi:hypothetical protein